MLTLFASDSLVEYNRIVENMKLEIAAVRNPRSRASRPRQSLTLQKRTSLLIPQQQEEANPADDEEWSSASASVSETDEPSLEFTSLASKSLSRTPPSEPEVALEEPVQYETQTLTIRTKEKDGPRESTMPPPRKERSPSPLPPARTPSPQHPPKASEYDLADDILNSMAAASPSPKKTRHTLSLAERTRLSMARPSHSQYSSDDDLDMVRLSIKPRQSMAPRTPVLEIDLHAGLIERTRKSMAGFEAAQKRAQMERRKSVKDAKKKQRESTFFPKVEEEVNTSAIELIEGEPDYESVFKSRPKIATSPAVSPTRLMEDDSED
ncbi:hypothetical protein LSUB1_G004618 [Lachnellula subtilissima]|uniref:Uncharacterized protein n=1 Tax=Lachnellula subtilissima TaxID=602034 RepID=A0A8H8RLX6_9HELO|nr:hypothetical protein LSUB1_G004618 [Lachnellula subtilissima]